MFDEIFYMLPAGNDDGNRLIPIAEKRKRK
jgi:hypothetical protein